MARAPKAAAQAPQGATEFIVLKVGEAVTPGATVTLLASCPTEEAAMEFVNQLADPSATRLAILEMKRLIGRRPAMAVSVVAENLLKAANKP